MTSALEGTDAGIRPSLLLIYSITATGILGNTMLSPALPDILEDLHLAKGQAGLIVSAGTLPGIVVAPLIGLLADRLGRKRVLVPCLSIFGLFGGAAAIAPNFHWLLAARLAQGIGSAGLINLAVVIISDNWEGVERTRLVGRNSAVLTFSLALFPPIGGVLTDLGGWRLAFVPYTIGIITAIAIARQLPEFRPGSDEKFLGQLRSAGSVARTPVIRATVLVGFVIFTLVFGLFLTTLPVYLEEGFGLSASQRGLVIAAPALPSTLMAFNLGRLRARLGIRRLLIMACVLFTAAFIIIGAANYLILILFGAALYGLGEGVFIPSLQDVAATAAPPAHRGAIVAIWVGAARAGQTAGPLMASALYASASAEATCIMGAGLAAALCVVVILGPLRDHRITPVPVGA